MRAQLSDVSDMRLAHRRRVVDAWKIISKNYVGPVWRQCIRDVAHATKESQTEAGQDPRLVDSTQGPVVHVYAGVSPYSKSMIYMVTSTTGLPHRYIRHPRGQSTQKHAGVAHDEFLDVLKCMLRLAREEMPADVRPHMIVMMDRAPAHTCKDVREFMKDEGFHDYLLPTKAGDINWMDWTFWNSLKQRVWVRLQECEDFKDFTVLVHKVWEETEDKAVLRSLCKN